MRSPAADKPASRFLHAAAWIYLAGAVLVAWLLRDRLNPDGICYIEVARHFVDGQYDLAINSWWSPAFSVLIMPALWLKIDPVFWARLIQIPAGLIFAQATSVLIRDAAGPAEARIGFLLGLCAALAMQTGPITPDVWHAAVLTWYFVFAQRWLREGGMKYAGAVGVLGGVSYLVKAYSLPFVLIHFTLTLFLRQQQPGHRPWRAALAQWSAVVALVAVISGPWVAVISAHDRELTMSSAGRYWTAAQPVNPQENAPILALFSVPPGRLTTLEDIRSMPLEWKPAPPFGKPSDQLRAVRRNFSELCFGLDRLDGIGLTKMFLVLCLALIFPLRTLAAEPVRLSLVWALMSVFVYLGGYTLTYFVDRFLWAIWGLLILLCVAGPATLVRQLRWKIEQNALEQIQQTVNRWKYVVLSILAICMLGGAGTSVLAQFAGGSSARAREIKEAAHRLPAGRMIAATDWYVGLNFTYWNRGHYLGVTSKQTPQDLAAELAPWGPVTLLVVEQPALAKALAALPSFQGIALGSSRIEAFEFRASAGAAPKKLETPSP